MKTPSSVDFSGKNYSFDDFRKITSVFSVVIDSPSFDELVKVFPDVLRANPGVDPEHSLGHVAKAIDRLRRTRDRPWSPMATAIWTTPFERPLFLPFPCPFARPWIKVSSTWTMPKRCHPSFPSDTAALSVWTEALAWWATYCVNTLSESILLSHPGFSFEEDRFVPVLPVNVLRQSLQCHI